MLIFQKKIKLHQFAFSIVNLYFLIIVLDELKQNVYNKLALKNWEFTYFSIPVHYKHSPLTISPIIIILIFIYIFIEFV